MAKKWQKVAALGRRRISLMRSDSCPESDACSTSVTDKGHFVVYTAEGRRFMVPLEYINSNIFKELFRLCEDEFGFPGNGPITLPFDAVVMDYVMSLLRRPVCKEVEKALLVSIFTSSCSTSSLLQEGKWQTIMSITHGRMIFMTGEECGGLSRLMRSTIGVPKASTFVWKWGARSFEDSQNVYFAGGAKTMVSGRADVS